MIRLIQLFIIVLFTNLFISGNVFGLMISPKNMTAQSNQSIIVLLNVFDLKQGKDIDAVGLTIQFDREILTYEGIDKQGSFLENFTLLNGKLIAPGKVKINGSYFSNVPIHIDSNGVFLKVKFSTKSITETVQTKVECLNFKDDISEAKTIPSVITISPKETASNTEISDIRITNIQGTIFTVSWVSSDENIGKVKYGTDVNDYEKWHIVSDDRGEFIQDDIHHVTIKGVAPDTTYMFEIISGDKTDNNNQTYYKVETGPALAPKSGSCQPTGKIFSDASMSISSNDDVILYMTIIGDKNKDNSSTISFLSQDGYWFTDLINFRTNDHNDYYEFECGKSLIRLEAQGGNAGTDQMIVPAIENKPESMPVIGIASNHTITVTTGSHGSITPDEIVLVDHHSDKTFYIQAVDQGYEVDQVFVDGKSIGNVSEYQFERIDSDHTISATFKKKSFSFSIISDENGTISPSNQITAVYGQSKSFQIIPDNCFEIESVTVDNKLIDTVNQYSFENISSNHTIEAKFRLKKFKISTTWGEHGRIEPGGESEILCGTTATFSIVPKNEYQISEVMIDGIAIGETEKYTFSNILSDHSIHADFSIKSYTISINSGEFGTMKPSKDIQVDSGSDADIEILPVNEHYEIKDVIVDGKSVGAVNAYTFTNITAPHSIQSMFTIKQYQVDITVKGNGSIQPSGSLILDSGASQEFSIMPEDCFYIYNVLVDGESKGQVKTLTIESVMENHNIEVIFQRYQYTVETIAQIGGKIQPKDDTLYNCGQDATFKIIPDNGFEVHDVTVDNLSIGAATEHVFTSMDQNHSIEVSFAAIYHLNEGWNLVNIILIPEQPFTAKNLAESINKSDAKVNVIQTWYGSGWNTYNVGADYSDFDIVVGCSYFILAEESGKWLNTGSKWDSPTYNIIEGYNLYGFPPYSLSNASELVQSINEQGNSITKVLGWNGNGWNYYSIDKEYTDFQLNMSDGYFLFAEKPGAFDILGKE